TFLIRFFPSSTLSSAAMLSSVSRAARRRLEATRKSWTAFSEYLAWVRSHSLRNRRHRASSARTRIPRSGIAVFFGESNLRHRSYGLLDSPEVLSTSFVRFYTEVIQRFLHFREFRVELPPGLGRYAAGVIDEIDQLNHIALEIRDIQSG